MRRRLGARQLSNRTPAASSEPAPDLKELLQRIQAYTDTFYGEFGNCVLEESTPSG